MELLKIENFTFTYGGADTPTLHDINLTINNGELVHLCGSSGSGKSTLLHCIKREIRPFGEAFGSMYFFGVDLEELTPVERIKNIGIVFQDPDNQTVMDTVMGEMAFALENLGFDSANIKRRVSEVAGFFGIEDILDKSPHEISGGQRQIVNLCSVLALRPKLMLLDEPLSQLDAVAQSEFLNIIGRINKEFAITILICEHKSEELMPMADKVVFLENGRIRYSGTPSFVAKSIMQDDNKQALKYLPTPTQIYYHLSKGLNEDIPFTVNDGKNYLSKIYSDIRFKSSDYDIPETANEVVVDVKNLLFGYSKKSKKVLYNLNLTVHRGDVVGILGGNGAGKSTLMKLLCGVASPIDGTIEIKGKKLNKIKSEEIHKYIFYIPQNPKLYFTFDTVREELAYSMEQSKMDEKKVKEFEVSLGLTPLLDRHPYDLSGGETGKVIIACALILNPEIILMDEATKGLDVIAKKGISDIIKKLSCMGKTVIMVSHDIEFMADNMKKCSMLFDGNLSKFKNTRDFFSDNFFYTTVAQRIFRDYNDVISIGDVLN